MPFDQKDTYTLRDLAKRVAEIGAHPRQAERREMWKRHNSLHKAKPMVLIFPEGSWDEALPKDSMECTDQLARDVEWHLRHLIYRWEHLRDDNVIEPWCKLTYRWQTTSWGLEPGFIHSEMARGAYAMDPPIKDPADLDKMRFPDLIIDDEKVERVFELVHDAIGDILEVQVRRRFTRWGKCSLIWFLVRLRGLDQLMVDMIDRPEWVHKAMSFLQEGTMRLFDQAEASGKLSLANTDEYVGSGGVAYTDELPGSGFDGRVRLRDLWGYGETQEFVSVSPDMHEEFALQYQKPMLDRFGLNSYGCCEPLTDRLDRIFTIPRLRRISISPWADLRVAAEQLQDKYIFSWKPNPSALVGNFDEQRIRREIREALEIAKDCVLEIILKDLHTVENDPVRLSRWVQIAQEETGGLA